MFLSNDPIFDLAQRAGVTRDEALRVLKSIGRPLSVRSGHSPAKGYTLSVEFTYAQTMNVLEIGRLYDRLVEVPFDSAYGDVVVSPPLPG